MTIQSPDFMQKSAEPGMLARVPEDPQPFVTIIMPIRNEAAFIHRSLAAVLAQDYPHDRMEVIIADGMSDDGTRQIIRELQQDHPNLRLVDNPARIVPTGLNAAIRQARGEIIVRVDGHTIVAPDYVRHCVRALHDSQAQNVGGPMRAIGQNYIARAIALATSTPFGIGNSAFHYSMQKQFVDTVYMGAFPRNTLVSVGLYDERYVRHQDYELNYRIRKHGGKILLSPDIRSHYFVRDSLSKLRRQYWQYGIWKGRFLRAHPGSLRLRHLAPPLFVAALLLTLLLAILSPIFIPALALILGAYILFILAALIHAARNGHARHAPLLPIILPTLHLSWGLGVWLGLLHRPLPPQQTTIMPNPP